MRFTPTPLAGLTLVDIVPLQDDRGHFARSFCTEEFAAVGLPTVFPQCNISFNKLRGTLRGMHWQADPWPEGKLVRCTRGAIFDVAVDLRPESPTYCRWFGAELTAGNSRALYIPEGFAHGFQALEDDSEVFYQMTMSYRQGMARGAPWNDPAFGIDWPLPNPVMSPRDAQHPPFQA